MEEGNKVTPWVVLVVFGLVIAAGAYWYLNSDANSNLKEDDSTDTVEDVDESDDASADSLTVILSEQNGSGQSGTMVLEELNGKVVATIVLSNPVTSDEPVHIHSGSCPTPGGIEFSLSSVFDGTSITTLDTTLAELEAMGPLAVNVHKSPTETSVYYSCGDLLF